MPRISIGISLAPSFVLVLYLDNEYGRRPLMKFVNEAAWDRIARVAIGVALLYLGWSGVVEGGLGTFLRFIGFLPLATGLLGWCPLYAVFRFRTNTSSREALKAS
jgi:hypothetical protein